MSPRNRVRGLFFGLAVGVTGACGSGTASVPVATGEAPPSEVRADLVPPVFDGLAAAEEDISSQRAEAGPASYLVSARLWSLRSGSKLQATLQVGRFAPDAFPSDEPDDIADFQARIVGQIGQAQARKRVIDTQEVFVTVHDDQPLYIWFSGQSLFVLSVAKDYPTPRSLLRSALALDA